MGGRGRIALGVAVLLIVAAIAWWWLRPAPRSVFFVEIRFEQGFAELSDEAAPAPTLLDNGFWLDQAGEQLHPAVGEPLARGGLALGLAWYRPDAHPPRQLAQTLLVTQGPGFSWGGPGPELRRSSDRFAGLAEPQPLELLREEDACVVTVDGEPLRVAIGEGARTRDRAREIGLDAAIERLRTAMPDLPEPGPELRETIGLRLDPEGAGRVTIHERYHVRCHGEVALHPDDLLVRLRAARAALSAGEQARARAELEALQRVAPRDPIVRALAEQLEAAPEGERALLTGTVELPAGAAVDLIPEVTLWPAGSRPEAAVAQVPAPDGGFRVHLPPGEYELQCRAPGHEPVRVRTRIPPEGEVRCVLR